MLTLILLKVWVYLSSFLFFSLALSSLPHLPLLSLSLYPLCLSHSLSLSLSLIRTHCFALNDLKILSRHPIIEVEHYNFTMVSSDADRNTRTCLRYQEERV